MSMRARAAQPLLCGCFCADPESAGRAAHAASLAEEFLPPTRPAEHASAGGAVAALWRWSTTQSERAFGQREVAASN